MEDKIKFYEIANILDLDLEYDGDETDLRLHGRKKLNWGAETPSEYEEATNAIDAISYKGNGWEVYATYDVSGFHYWMLQQEEPNYINMTIMFDNDTIDATEIPAIKNAMDMAYSDAYSIAEKYDYVPNSEYKRGGKVDGRSTRAKDTWNRGGAWTRDRNAHNKSENWEKPMNKRKYAEGGGVDTYYRVFDTQRGVYFATGYNATSMNDLIEDFQSYILGASEIDFEHEQGTAEYEQELNDFLGTWDLIAEHLQGVELEESSTPFEDEYEFKRGGKVDGRSTRAKDTWNSGASWTRDRNAYNKSEDWEKPLNQRGKTVSKSVTKSSSSASSKSSSSASSKGKSKNYSYIPNYMIRGAEVNNSGKTTDIDGANILDGIYVKAGTKYAEGGGVPDLDKKMALINLDMIHEYSVKLDNMVTEETELEEWVKMKLTRIEQNVSDVKHAVSGGEKFDGGGMIFKKQLLHISKYAKELIDMVQAGSNLMAWQENKLAIAADNIDGIYHYMDYLENKNKKISDEYLPFAEGGGISDKTSWTVGQERKGMCKYYFLYNENTGERKGHFDTMEEAKETMDSAKRYGLIYAKGGGVGAKKSKKQKAIDLLVKNIKYSFVNTDMGSGWEFVLYAPFSTSGYGKDVLEEMKYLDLFDAEDMGIEDWDNLSKKDKDYYYNDWKNDLFDSSFESFKNKVVPKHLYFFEEELQKDEYKNGGNVGRDWIFKSKQKWEQDYDRKREYKEYKKEGWLANWFKDGGEAKEYGADEIGTYDFVYIKSLGGKEGMVMEISGENCRVRTDENRLAEKDTWFNKSDLKVARGNNERLFAKGGRVKNYKYVPNHMIESVDVERNGKTTEIDGGNILDGLYVKGKVNFEEGGYVENIPTETLEAMIGRKLNGWNDDKVIFNGIVYKKCFMKPYYKIA